MSFDRSLLARWPAGSTDTDATRLFVAIETLLQDPDVARAIMSSLSDRLTETPKGAKLDVSGYRFEIAVKAGVFSVTIDPQKHPNAYRSVGLGVN
ncbi:MAG: hypothetical protein Q8M31_01540 [Beijerinckiaceae bacterium]|nr:hypothetical protein [Beijerinckiaceae bacterium]